MNATGIDPLQLLITTIQPVLVRLALPSPKSAEAMLLGIAAQESNFRFLMQKPTGPALGIFQMEAATHDDLWRNFLAYQSRLAEVTRSLQSPGVPAASQLAGNLYYAAACCRVQLYRAPEPLPAPTDITGMARLWKKRWNSPLGAGTEEQFIANWKAFDLDSVIGR